MSPSHKVEVLDWLSRGQSVASVGGHNGVNKSNIRYIRKNEKAIRERVAASTVPSSKLVTHVWDVHIERMEKALSVWIEDNVQKKHAFKWTSHSCKGDVYVRASCWHRQCKHK